jgi:hypothetical protein
MRRLTYLLLAIPLLLSACATVNLNAPIPVYETGVDSEAWALVPAGDFLSGQHNHAATLDYDFEIMVTDVTVGQYTDFLKQSLADGVLRIEGQQVVGGTDLDQDAGVILRHAVEALADDFCSMLAFRCPGFAVADNDVQGVVSPYTGWLGTI